jgi:radical SAM superfamily enzyme YgiQ (UPF0313 family)
MPPLKIALVEAVSDSTHVYSRTRLPRVGIATLGAVIKQKGYVCDLWYTQMRPEERKNLETYDVVGIGSLSSTIGEAYRLADELRGKNITVVMGGPHVSFMPEEALAHCDYVVTGEGEQVFADLIATLSRREKPASQNGLSFKNSDGSFSHGGMAVVVDYESLPSPDFNLARHDGPFEVPPIVVTSRGCPHNCSFCSVTPIFGRKYRFKSNEQVIAELRPVQHRSVCFGDDNFCANPARTKSLLREMIDKKAVPLRWSGQMCVNAASDPELLSLMQETRCRIVYVGVESVNPETLNKYGKAHKVDAVAKCVEQLHKHDIGIHGMFVVDSNDSPDAAKNIVDYAMAVDMDTIQVFSLTPFPGARAYDEYKDRLIHHDWTDFDGMHVVVQPEKCSAYTMQSNIVNEMSRFYSLKRALTAYKKNRHWRVSYRLGGYVLMKKWIKENRNYMEKLQKFRPKQ